MCTVPFRIIEVALVFAFALTERLGPILPVLVGLRLSNVATFGQHVEKYH
jgi:hypothetical protein